MNLVFPFSRFQVEGESMLPQFRPGDSVLVWCWSTIREGDSVVFYKNGLKMIKRAHKKTAGGHWIVRGANVGVSTDSLDFGEVREENIIGKVICRY